MKKAIKFSANINKIATLRNSRGGDIPNLIQCAKDIQIWGVDGITVHPRPDERHIRYQDVRMLKEIITTEFNIEGNPQEPKFVELVLSVKPTQVTLVPDALQQLTSNHGWDTSKHKKFLTEIIEVFKKAGIRTSIFIDPIESMVSDAAEIGTQRIELYTEFYAHTFATNKEKAITPYKKVAHVASVLGLDVNAGHDLNLQNLNYFANHIEGLLEVSIGQAFVADALYVGFEKTITAYKKELQIC
ncbi:MAG: pyridoxine 5'-phosphate synthase [Chitinophagaceae bacterium]